MSLSFHRVDYRNTLRTFLFLNIGNSDFGFVSDFEFRASNFFGCFLPGSIESIRVYHQRRWV
jgi:hypothetical protein